MQLQAMAKGAAGLELPVPDVESRDLFPRETDAAMWRGSLQALVGAVGEAQRLTGASSGSAEVMQPDSSRNCQGWNSGPLRSDLVMKGLVDLMPNFSSDPDR